MPKKAKKKYGAVICPACNSRVGMITLMGRSTCMNCKESFDERN